jgi:hypothetical protein
LIDTQKKKAPDSGTQLKFPGLQDEISFFTIFLDELEANESLAQTCLGITSGIVVGLESGRRNRGTSPSKETHRYGGRIEEPAKRSRPTLASVHKYLRPCDLCKELAFGTSTRK